ncbi:MAG: aminoglycoside phosphotransferase family protein [Chitinophagales bacterium]
MKTSTKIKETAIQIFEAEWQEKVERIEEIVDLGSVNRVFDIDCSSGGYILRLNEEEKRLEFVKEKYCMDKAGDLGLPVPKVLKLGLNGDNLFMLQYKIEGVNGSKCDAKEKIRIWEQLGNYASKYQQIPRINVPEIEANEFHKTWKHRLKYNIEELNPNDSLLQSGVLKENEQTEIKSILTTLLDRDFKTGLVHGDLCPRNTIFDTSITHLLDWGTAEINVVPHTEIGVLLMQREANEGEFDAFLKGMGISKEKYSAILPDIRKLNLLYRLDKYRWAVDFDVEGLKDYEEKVVESFENCSLIIS